MMNKWEIEDDMQPMVEKLLPSLIQHRVIDRNKPRNEISSSHILHLAEKVGISAMEPDTHPPQYYAPREILDRLTKYAALSEIFTRRLSYMDRSIIKNNGESVPVNKYNPFGRITGQKGANVSSEAVIYMSRKAVTLPQDPSDDEPRTSATTPGSSSSRQPTGSRAGSTAPGQDDAFSEALLGMTEKQENSIIAQRKVAKALMQMVANETMLFHFVTKGGIEAINRLVNDSTDQEVFLCCALTLLRASQQSHYCPILVSKDVMPTLQTIVDNGDEEIWLATSKILMNVSYSGDSIEADKLIILAGVFPVLQSLLLQVKRADTVCYIILVLNNLARVFDGDAVAFIVRSIIGMSGRLEVLSNLANAIFFTDILRSMSRLPRYMNALCEESVLPVLLNTMNETMHPKIVLNMAESFVNLSMSKKNRREISGCGIALYLDRIFVMGSPDAKSHILRMIGNLLNSNLFHDRIAREDTLSSMLNNLLDPAQPAQFNGVVYCLSQLAVLNSSVTALVNCDVVHILLEHLADTPTDALGYIFTLFVTVASKREFVHKLSVECHLLVPFMYGQVVGGADEDDAVKPFIGSGGATWTQQGQKQTLAVLAYNLSLLDEFTAAVTTSPKLTAWMVKMLKELIKGDQSEVGKVRLLSFNALINLAEHNSDTRAAVLGGDIKTSSKGGSAQGEDLIEMMKAIGYDDPDLNLRFVALISIISNEENLCSRLLDRGTHVLLVAVLSALATYDAEYAAHGKEEGLGTSKVPGKGQGGSSGVSGSGGLLPAVVGSPGSAAGVGSGSGSGSSTAKRSKGKTPEQASGRDGSLLSIVETVNQRLHEQAREELFGNRSSSRRGASGRAIGGRMIGAVRGASKEGKELLKEMAAAAIHNISLKRAVLGPGILTCLLSLARGCKTIRVLHSVRALANLSVNLKSKMALAKEMRLVPVLVDAMRSGCEEAERVQHYAAQVICNVLAGNLDKSVLEDLIKHRIVMDIVVVALLRVQDAAVKESLSKALFNLLSHDKFRLEMIGLQVLAAVIELAKIESQEILELAARCVYNVTCQTAQFSDKIRADGVPAFLLNRATGFKAHDFDKAGTTAAAAAATAAGVTTSSASDQKPSRDIVDFSSQAKQDQLAELGLISSTTVKLLCGMGLANISFDSGLSTLLCCDMGTDAILSVFRLNTDQAAYCAAVVIYNTSKLADCGVFLADHTYLPTVMELMERGPILCSQLVAAALVNYSLRTPFYDQLSLVSVGAALRFMDNPNVDESIKTDILKILYNLVTNVESSRHGVVHNDGMAVLWRYVKNVEDESLQGIVGRIVRECCSIARDREIHKKLMRDGVMRILLKLSKVEVPPLKTDISYAIFDMTVGPDTLKVLKWDGIDVLFWLTVHDCMNLMDTVRLNVARSLRNFSANSVEDAKFLSADDRCSVVIRALAKSGKEEVLHHAIGATYNLLTVEECKVHMVRQGIIQTIFELADAGFMSVRHVCSSCLHMAPEAIPDMSDPAVLQLVLCLLDVDPEMVAAAEKGSLEAQKRGNLAERFLDPIPYVLVTKPRNTTFQHNESGFQQTWLTLTTEVDKIFSPALISLPQERALGDLELRLLLSECILGEDSAAAERRNYSNKEPESILTNVAFNDRMEPHEKYHPQAYDDFREVTQTVEARLAQAQAQAQAQGFSNLTKSQRLTMDTSSPVAELERNSTTKIPFGSTKSLNGSNDSSSSKSPTPNGGRVGGVGVGVGISVGGVDVRGGEREGPGSGPRGTRGPSSPGRLSLVGAHASNWGFAETSSPSPLSGDAVRADEGSSSSSSLSGSEMHRRPGGLGPKGGDDRNNGSPPHPSRYELSAPVPSTPQPPQSRLGTSHSTRAGAGHSRGGDSRDSRGNNNSSPANRGKSPSPSRGKLSSGGSASGSGSGSASASRRGSGRGSGNEARGIKFEMEGELGSMGSDRRLSSTGVGGVGGTGGGILRRGSSSYTDDEFETETATNGDAASGAAMAGGGSRGSLPLGGSRVSFSPGMTGREAPTEALQIVPVTAWGSPQKTLGGNSPHSSHHSPTHSTHALSPTFSPSLSSASLSPTQGYPTQSHAQSLAVSPSQVHFPRLSNQDRIPANTLKIIRSNSLKGTPTLSTSSRNLNGTSVGGGGGGGGSAGGSFTKKTSSDSHGSMGSSGAPSPLGAKKIVSPKGSL